MLLDLQIEHRMKYQGMKSSINDAREKMSNIVAMIIGIKKRKLFFIFGFLIRVSRL